MALQMRRGLYNDFDPTKMLPGEWAVAIDSDTSKQVVWMCFAPGVTKRMGTYEDFRGQILEIFKEVNAPYIEELEKILERVEELAASAASNSAVIIKIKDDVTNQYLPQMLRYYEGSANNAQSAAEDASRASSFASSASASATSASASETNAKASERAAAGSASAASSKATAAASSASAAKTSETNAKTSETNAAGSKSAAASSAATASQKAADASDYATQSKSYAVGGTGIRPGEDADNSKYYYEEMKEISKVGNGIVPMGRRAFANLPMTGNIRGHMYEVADAFVTDERFTEGAGYSYPSGTNVYWTHDGKWDCLSGALVRQLTQAEYDALTEAEKLNGTMYIISDADNAIPLATQYVDGLMSAADKTKLDGLGGSGAGIEVDAELSATSQNPIQNQAVTAALEGKAGLSSPTFTGLPKAPTASSGTNSTQIATTAFANNAVSNHNSSSASHSDIRSLITGLTTRLNALADSDDETLDQMSEIVSYIKANRTLIESVTTSKVSVSDIVDSLTSTDARKPLSANQGKALKDMISVLESAVPEASAATPKAPGTSNAGSSAEYARGDHVHPAQTSVSGNAGTATKLAAARNINGMSFDGSANRANYGVCSTAASTAAKTVACAGFALVTGAKMDVKFSSSNTASNPTLNVNGTGAKPIHYRGSAIAASYLAANRTYGFRYNGTQWDLVGDVNVDTNTWKANTASSEGYVAKGSGNPNKVWKTDANGNPGWRDEEKAESSGITPESIGALPISGGVMKPVTGGYNKLDITGCPLDYGMGSTHLSGAKGSSAIRWTGSPGAHAVLSMFKSTNGRFMDVVHSNKRSIEYMSEETVAAGTNSPDHSTVLVDESGNSSFPGIVKSNNAAYYAVCNSGFSAETKTVSTPMYIPLVQGFRLYVKFVNGNAVAFSNMTLKLNSTEAKPVYGRSPQFVKGSVVELLYDGEGYAVMDEGPIVISRVLRSAGWYRFAKINSCGGSAVISIDRFWGSSSGPRGDILSIALGFGDASFSQLNGRGEGSGIDKVRYIGKEKDAYLELHYTLSAANTVFASMAPSGYEAAYMYAVDFEPGEIPDGYNVVEFDLTKYNGGMKASTLEGNLIGTVNGLKVREDILIYKKLTQAEYDALTEAEKLNGTMYYITDAD